MIFLYTAALLLIGAAYFLFKRRAAAFERKYTNVAKEADGLLRQLAHRDGNNNRQDPYLNAKRQFKLAMLAEKRDRIESRWSAWQKRAERLGQFRRRLMAWKGRKLPYTFGVLDVAGALAMIDYFGAGHYLNARHLLDLVTSLLKHG